jgi:hypothetical protein
MFMAELEYFFTADNMSDVSFGGNGFIKQILLSVLHNFNKVNGQQGPSPPVTALGVLRAP